MRYIRAAFAAIMLLGAGGPSLVQPAHAQTDNELRVRGTISAIAADSVTVLTAAGEQIAVKLSPSYNVIAYAPIRLQDVAPNAYVGVASTPQADGSFRALSVVVFPEAFRGLNEGTKGWDLGPQSRMTNATVAQLAGQPDGGREILLRFGSNAQTQRVVVTPQTVVSTFGPADKALVAVGAKVVLFAARAADGTISSGIVAVGADGKVPPV